MKYDNIVPARFIDRPNRFVAHVDIDGKTETVHVKNTGRCRELLLKGSEVWLVPSDNTERKTKYDLVAVRKENSLLFNIDSQAPNKVAREWLEKQGFSKILPEYRYGASRIDFYTEKENERCLIEVKGCTLEVGGVGYFPDAPTERGVKHLKELIKAKKEGYRAIIAFVIQVNGVSKVLPNTATHPEFALTLEEARKEGVEILYIRCRVDPGEIVPEGARFLQSFEKLT